MSGASGLDRYRHIGPIYDVVSLERSLYSTPRRRLLSIIGPIEAATVVDVGCGTGLNLPGLVQLTGPAGRVIGLDASASMVSAARRRVHAARWTNVTVVQSSAEDMLAALEVVGVNAADIDVVVATFVVSTMPDDSGFWQNVDVLAQTRTRVIALADLGEPSSFGPFRRIALRAFAALGGNHPASQPWVDLARRSVDTSYEEHLGGHVRLAVGHCGPLAASQ